MHLKPEVKPLAQVTELAGRQRWGGSGSLLPTPSPQSHAAPTFAPSAGVCSSGAGSSPSSQPQARQAGPRRTRSCMWSAPGGAHVSACTWQPGSRAGCGRQLAPRPPVCFLGVLWSCEGIELGEQIPSSQLVRALLPSAHSSLPRILTLQVTASEGKSEWQPQSSSMSFFRWTSILPATPLDSAEMSPNPVAFPHPCCSLHLKPKVKPLASACRPPPSFAGTIAIASSRPTFPCPATQLAQLQLAV